MTKKAAYGGFSCFRSLATLGVLVVDCCEGELDTCGSEVGENRGREPKEVLGLDREFSREKLPDQVGIDRNLDLKLV